MCFKYSVALFGLIFGFCLRFEFNFGGLVVLLDAEHWFVEIVDLPLDPTLDPCSRSCFFFKIYTV